MTKVPKMPDLPEKTSTAEKTDITDIMDKPSGQRKQRSLVLSALNGIIVLAVFLFLFAQLSYLHRGYDRMMRFYGLKPHTLDAVVIGTSTTFTSYMPMEVYEERGLASAVAATNMQFEDTLRFTVREVLSRQEPKLILIDVMPFLRAHYAGTDAWNEGDRDLNIRYNLDSLRYGPVRASLVREICRGFGLGWEKEVYYHLDLVRYHLNQPDLKRLGNAVKDAGRGFQHLQKEGGEAFTAGDMIPDDGGEISLPDAEQANLEALLSVLQSEGGAAGQFRTIFYCPPVFLDTKEQVGRKNYLNRFLTEAGYTFWDLTKEREEAGLLAEEDYRDPVHFDSLGAQKVTALISRKIAAYEAENPEFRLPDRRNDPAYAEWNESLGRWKEELGGYLGVDQGA